MLDVLNKLRDFFWIGIVGGSDQAKIVEQFQGYANADFPLSYFDYVFSENGLVAIEYGESIGKMELASRYSQEVRERFESYCLSYIQQLQLPFKTSQHIEVRSGMWNISPVGRACSSFERGDFEVYDFTEHVRQTMIDKLKHEFQDMDLSFSIGEQISFDVFPRGWGKTYCLRFLNHIDNIHFIGDKVERGGNDYEIYSSFRTISHATWGPQGTIALCQSIQNQESQRQERCVFVLTLLDIWLPKLLISNFLFY